jgi:DNA-binding IclR family transcriptional regulator
LAYEGYVIRREDGTYIVGLEISDRYRELVSAFRGPPAVGEVLRRAANDTGYSHFLGRFVGGRIAVTAVAEGARSPYVDDMVPGFDEGGHATALGKALLATLTPDQRARYLRDWGMRAFTPATLVTPEALEADLAAGERRGMQLEMGQFRQGLACAAVTVLPDRDMERRLVLACALPAAEMLTSARVVRSKLMAVARGVADALSTGDAATA